MLNIEECKKASEELSFNLDGKKFNLSKLVFIDANYLYSFYVDIEKQIIDGRRAFMRSDEFINKILPLLSQSITLKGMEISKINNFFDDTFHIYDDLIINSLQVFSYPFFASRIASLDEKTIEQNQK